MLHTRLCSINIVYTLFGYDDIIIQTTSKGELTMTKLTSERASKITEFLSSDVSRATEILSLSAEEALAEINGGQGNDFTLDEIVEYGKRITQAKQLDNDALANVAGGAGHGDMDENFISLGAAAAIASIVGVVYNIATDIWDRTRG